METTTISTFLEYCNKNDIEKVLHLLKRVLQPQLEAPEGTPESRTYIVGESEVAGFSIDSGNLEENTGLQIAAANGFEKLTEILLNKGADTEKSNNFGFTPLMHAVCNDHVNIIMVLLNQGANVNSFNRYGMTPLLIATARGQSKIVKILVENGADVNCKSSIDLTPTMVAAQYRHEHLIGYFSRKGVNINEKTNNGITALMLATNGGEKSTIKALLDRGADSSIVNCRQDTAMNIALTTKNTDGLKNDTIADYIHKKTRKKLKAVNQDTFLKAIGSGEYSSRDFIFYYYILLFKVITTEVKCRLEKDWLMSNTTRKEDGMSALMLASISGDVELMKILCHYGANCDLQDNNGWTALMWAAINGHVESCKVILKYCDPYIKNNEDLTAADMMTLIGNGDSPVEEIFEDLLVIGPCIKTEESAKPRKVSQKKKFPNPLQWLKRTKKDSFSVPSSDRSCGMNSLNFKFRGNDIQSSLSGMEQKDKNDDVATILQKMNLDQYIRIFKEEIVEKEDFMGLTYEDLNYLEIESASDQQKLMSVIRSLEEISKGQSTPQNDF
ncbi:Ankyrin repeat and SAM domain-containing protein 6 [Nymphon striatum]|nr:Ankyrin repeat and SAM domain-containing protein 6 [Nymphon striatum]